MHWSSTPPSVLCSQSELLEIRIAAGQEDSLSLQKQLAEDGTKLEAALEASRGSVRLMLEEFQLSTQEQKNMIFEVSKC